MPRSQPKRLQRRALRLSLIGGTLLLIASGLYGLYTFQNAGRQDDPDKIITAAREAYQQADYARVVELLEQNNARGTTLPAIAGDAELLNIYVQARRQTPLPDAGHLRRLVTPLQQIVRLDPENTQARDELIELLIAMQRFSEAKRLTEDLVEKHPEDPALWNALGSAYAGMGAHRDAIQAYRQAAELDPLSVRTQLALIQLTRSQGADTAPILEHAQRVYAQHPEDPRAELIRALAYLVEDDAERARTLILSAAQRPAPDDAFIRDLVQWLDRMDLYPASAAYLGRIADAGGSEFARAEAVLRDYDSGDLRGVLTRLEGRDPGTLAPDLIAVWALSCDTEAQQSELDRLINPLARRSDPLAQAWHEVLNLVLLQQAPPGTLIDRLPALIGPDAEDAASIGLEHNPYLNQMLGEAYLQVDEPERAIRAMDAAAKARPSWARPHRLLAQTLLDTGRPHRALRHAEMAWLRQPNNAAAALRIEAMLRAADRRDPDDVKQAITAATQLLKQLPDHPGVLPALVELLAQTNQTGLAGQTIRDTLRLDPPASAPLLTALIRLDERYQLGLSQPIRAALQDHHGSTPDAALEQARSLALAGRPDRGRALLEQAMPDPPDLAWRTALGSYLKAVGDADAAAYWIRLADDHPDDIQLQLAALRTSGVYADETFCGRAIQRLRATGGENAIHWRLEQARLLMRHDSPRDTDLRRAQDLLKGAERQAPGLVEVQIELARCLLLAGDLASAEASARKAKTAAPGRPAVSLLLGQVLHQQKQYKAARIELQPVADDEEADPTLRYTACALLLRQGDAAMAQPALESMRKTGQADTPALILLAQIYEAAGQTERGDAICQQLMATPDMQAAAFVAGYYTRTGRPGLAEQVRAAAASAGLHEADRITLDAQDAARRGDMGRAMRLIRQAAQAQPNNPDRWRDAVQMALALSQHGEAVALARAGLKQVGAHAGLSSVADNPPLIKQISDTPSLTPIAVAMLTREDQRAAAITALRICHDQAEPGRTASRLAELANTHTEFQALQELACDQLITAGINDQAYDMASAAVLRFPNSASLTRSLTVAAYRLGDWITLKSAAQAWRERDPDSRHLADLMLAASDDALKQYPAVIKTLTPHIESLPGGPEANPQHYLLYTRALARTRQSAQAWKTLAPHIDPSARARLIALQLIGSDLGNAQTALAWLNEINQRAGDSTDERLERAKAACMAGVRLNDPALLHAARDTVLKITSAPGPHPAEVYELQGQVAQALGDADQAEASFRRLLKQAPDNPQVLNNLAMVLAQRGGGRLNEAEQLATRAVKLEPQDPNLLDTLALVRLKRGQLEQAESAITQAIRMDPGNPAWRLTHAEILDAMGKTDQAQIIRKRYAGASAD